MLLSYQKEIFVEYGLNRLENFRLMQCYIAKKSGYKANQRQIIDARGMSDGTLRFLGILTALLTRPKGTQIIIEEVDNGLHPSRSGLLLRILKEIGYERKIDVLVTTHNPSLLDAMGPEMIPFIVVAHRNPHTGESKLTLLEDVQNLPKLLASGPLGRVTSQGAIEKSLSEDEGSYR